MWNVALTYCKGSCLALWMDNVQVRLIKMEAIDNQSMKYSEVHYASSDVKVAAFTEMKKLMFSLLPLSDAENFSVDILFPR